MIRALRKAASPGNLERVGLRSIVSRRMGGHAHGPDPDRFRDKDISDIHGTQIPEEWKDYNRSPSVREWATHDRADEINYIDSTGLDPSIPYVLTGPYGTEENPVRVPSQYNHRYVGCVGGKNGHEEHELVWFVLRRGPRHRCPVCAQVFVLETSWKPGDPEHAPVAEMATPPIRLFGWLEPHLAPDSILRKILFPYRPIKAPKTLLTEDKFWDEYTTEELQSLDADTVQTFKTHLEPEEWKQFTANWSKATGKEMH
jgi:hypothetical protein